MKISNKLSGFHHAEHFMHFHSKSKCISAIIIEIKTGNTLKCMLCFFRSNLSLLAKMVIGKTISLPLELTEKKLVKKTKYHSLLPASVIVCIILYGKNI